MAFCSFALLLPALKTDIVLLADGMTGTIALQFLLPLLTFMAFWFLVPGLSQSFLAILEHEITHILFAVLTFHPPQDISVKSGVGGFCTFKGPGNWLITSAPYFFPTFAGLILGIGAYYTYTETNLPIWYLPILGIVTGYHLVSTISEFHTEQTDIKNVGYLFSFLFLPTANLLAYGILIAVACFGHDGFSQYGTILQQEISNFIRTFI